MINYLSKPSDQASFANAGISNKNNFKQIFIVFHR